MKKHLFWVVVFILGFAVVAYSAWDGATNYPAALDDDASVYDVEDAGTVEDEHHDAVAQAVIAIETKLGIGTDTPTATDILTGTGAGTSGWTTVTGTGAPVKGTEPTIASPVMTGVGSIKIAGVIEGAINVYPVNGAYTIGTTEATEAYGTLFISNGATPVLTMPATLVAGMNGCLIEGQSRTDVLKLVANASDYIVLDGVRTTAHTEFVASAGAATDRICWVVGDATDIYVTASVGTWTEE